MLYIYVFMYSCMRIYDHFIFSSFFSAKAAKLAVKAGVDGILVSSHGGRQLVGAPPPVSWQSTDSLLYLNCAQSDQSNLANLIITRREQVTYLKSKTVIFIGFSRVALSASSSPRWRSSPLTLRHSQIMTGGSFISLHLPVSWTSIARRLNHWSNRILV